MIRRQTEQLTRIVNDLLDIARLTAGKLVLQQTRLDLGALVEKCVAELASNHLLDRHVYDVRVVAGAGPRRRRAPRADRHQPADQRRQVHAARRRW